MDFCMHRYLVLYGGFCASVFVYIQFKNVTKGYVTAISSGRHTSNLKWQKTKKCHNAKMGFYASTFGIVCIGVCIGVWSCASVSGFLYASTFGIVYGFFYASVSKITKNQKVSQCQDVFVCIGVWVSVHRRLVFCYASLFDCSGLISRLIVQMG